MRKLQQFDDIIIELSLVGYHQHMRDPRHRAGQPRFGYRFIKSAFTQIKTDAELFWFDIDRRKLALFQVA